MIQFTNKMRNSQIKNWFHKCSFVNEFWHYLRRVPKVWDFVAALQLRSLCVSGCVCVSVYMCVCVCHSPPLCFTSHSTRVSANQQGYFSFSHRGGSARELCGYARASHKRSTGCNCTSIATWVILNPRQPRYSCLCAPPQKGIIFLCCKLTFVIFVPISLRRNPSVFRFSVILFF